MYMHDTYMQDVERERERERGEPHLHTKHCEEENHHHKEVANPRKDLHEYEWKCSKGTHTLPQHAHMQTKE